MMTSYESSVEQEKGEHSTKRMSAINGNLEANYKPVYRRRRISKVKHTHKPHSVHKDLSDYITDNGHDHENDTSIRSRSKKSERRRKKKLSVESNMEGQTFEEGDGDSGIISSRARDKRLSKDTLRIANEYLKLEKRYEHIQGECQKLSTLLERREAEYQRVCSHYERLVQVVQEMEAAKLGLAKCNHDLETEKCQSTEDIGLLKSVVYQLNAELERYEDKLKDKKLEISSADIPENTGKKEQNSRKVWGGVNFHALGPLLNAYQENLSEKRELVSMYEQEMTDFGSRCKEVLTENELMHKEVEELKSECDRYTKEMKTLIQNTASLKKQNDLLLKENIDLKRKVNEICSSYELKMEVMLKHNDTLQKEHAVSSSELNNLRGKYEILSREFEKVKNKEDQTVPTIVHTTAIEECRTLLEELKYRYETEKRNLCNHIKRLEENQPENEKELVMIIAERNHLKNLVENLERNLRRAQRKTEQTQTLLHTTRVSRDSLKEQLNKTTAYCEELFSEYERIAAEREKLLSLLRETEKENANIDRLGKSITSRVDGLKHQLETVRRGAKQQVETVEKRIKLQELRIHRMKHEYRKKIQYLKDIIKQKEETTKKLQKEKHVLRNRTTNDEEPKATTSSGRIENV